MEYGFNGNESDHARQLNIDIDAIKAKVNVAAPFRWCALTSTDTCGTPDGTALAQITAVVDHGAWTRRCPPPRLTLVEGLPIVSHCPTGTG